MNQGQIEKQLYRIIRGRLRVNVDGLVYYIQEPSAEMVDESYYVYDEVYEKCFMNGVYIDSELSQVLISNDMWTPLHDQKAEELKKSIDNKKVEAFENFFNTKKLKQIKFQLAQLNKQYMKFMAEKHALDSATCHAIAEQARWEWLLNSSIFDLSNNPVPGDRRIIEAYRNSLLTQDELRAVAKYSTWRTMWVAAKRCGSLFSKPSTELTRDQISLCSLSLMYDNVYEHPECPDDKIVEDDDCLDGWFIIQKRNQENEKKKKSADSAIGNEKIRNAREQFIMVDSDESAKQVLDLNSPVVKSVITQREQLVEQKGQVKDLDFNDVKQEVQLQANKSVVDRMKGK